MFVFFFLFSNTIPTKVQQSKIGWWVAVDCSALGVSKVALAAAWRLHCSMLLFQNLKKKFCKRTVGWFSLAEPPVLAMMWRHIYEWSFNWQQTDSCITAHFQGLITMSLCWNVVLREYQGPIAAQRPCARANGTIKHCGQRWKKHMWPKKGTQTT